MIASEHVSGCSFDAFDRLRVFTSLSSSFLVYPPFLAALSIPRPKLPSPNAVNQSIRSALKKTVLCTFFSDSGSFFLPPTPFLSGIQSSFLIFSCKTIQF